jgi:phage baseplate assembly protein gpV
MAILPGSTFKVAYAPTQNIYDGITNPDAATLYFIADRKVIMLNGLEYGFDSSIIGASNGIAPLDANQLIPSAYLPSYVDDVVEYIDAYDTQRVIDSTFVLTHISGEEVNTFHGSLNEYVFNYANNKLYQCTEVNSPNYTWTYVGEPTGFPDEGFQQGKIYINKSTNKQYRATTATPYATNLAFIGSGLALGETQFTAYRGDRGKIAYDHSLRTDNPHGITLSTFGITSSAAEINALADFTGDYLDLNYAKDLRATGITTTEFGYLDGVTSNIQTQLDDKLSKNGDTMLGALTMNLGFTGTTDIDSLPIIFSYKEEGTNKTSNLLVDKDGNLKLDDNTVYHSGNFTINHKLSTSGGTMTGNIIMAAEGSTTVHGSRGITFDGYDAGSAYSKELWMNTAGQLEFGGNEVYHEGNEPVTWTVLS